MSNRSTVTCEYKIDHDGSFTYMQSSKGNEAHVTANAKTIGKNVLALSIINFARYCPCEGGFDITCVVSADPGGSIPDMIKNKQAARHAQAPCNLANFILTGATPSD